MSKQIPCTNCGAVMVPGPDGRTYACPFWTAKQQVAIDAGQIALGMQLDLANGEAFLARIAVVLQTSLSDHTKVHADGGRVLLVELSLDKDRFVVKREPHGVVAQHKRMVKGVALKTVTHPLPRWVELLSEALAHHANTSASAAQALAQIKGQS